MRRESTAGTEAESAYYAYAADNSLTKRKVVTPPSTNVDTYYYYDNNGSMTSFVEGASSTYFAYNDNHLVARIAPPSEAASYFYYDGRLNRYCQNIAGTQTYYLWNGMNP